MNSAIEQAIKDAVEKGGWNSDGFIRADIFPNGFSDIRADWNHDVELRRISKKGEKGRWVSVGKLCVILLDPLFWQALGKARGWGASGIYAFGRNLLEWEANWHRFIAHLASGGTSEDFFKEL